MNLRRVTSLTEYREKTAGESRDARGGRERAGIVTYVRIRVYVPALVGFYHSEWSSNEPFGLESLRD